MDDRSTLKKLGVCVISPGTNLYNSAGGAIVGNAQGAAQATSSFGATLSEPFSTGLQILAVPAAIGGGVFGAGKSLVLSVLNPPFASFFGALNPYTTALDSCVGLPDELAKTPWKELRETERKSWVE